MNGQCRVSCLNGLKIASKWVESISDFKEDFIKRYNDDIDKGYFLQVDSDCQYQN